MLIEGGNFLDRIVADDFLGNYLTANRFMIGLLGDSQQVANVVEATTLTPIHPAANDHHDYQQPTQPVLVDVLDGWLNAGSLLLGWFYFAHE